MASVNYSYWDDPSLIQGFDTKHESDFFYSERYFLDKIKPATLESVLDVGCSCGRFVELLKTYGFDGSFSGLDVSAPSIKICRRNYPDDTFYQKNIFDLRGEDKYTLVNATGVAQHETRLAELIEKMVSLSDEYIMFDIKIADIESPLADISRCYCELDGQRIHMLVYPLRYILSLLSEIVPYGRSSLLAYETPFNSMTVHPKSIEKWASCGVFIDLRRSKSIEVIEIPSFVSVR